ncbi:BTB domain-containing protein, partial [Oryctes borbonicus]
EMEELIREGALRLLTSESSCDVILSCKGYRLMAHKVILSIASPILQALLRQDDTVPTVIIFPDISGNTMSLVLDYIYSGSVNVRSDILTEFITVANELKLQIDNDSVKMKYFESIEDKIKPDCKYITDKLETDLMNAFVEDEYRHQLNNDKNALSEESVKITNSEVNKGTKKSVRKMPSLLPLSKIKRRKVLHNYITPSPW